MGLPDPVVCIVGAGPAGLVTAHLLHQAGLPFVLLERQQADQLRARVKAGMLEHRTVELLQRHGLAGPILRGGLRVGQCEWRADGQAFLLDYAKLCGGRGHYIYPQHDLVADWAGDLLARGGDVRFGFTVTGIEQAGDGALVRATAGPDGAPVTIECLAVVVCDGAGSRPPVERGEFTERDILDLRVRVCDPMQHGRLYLAGDAAHLITPAGGKGMNIAIQDAAELAGGLIERYGGRGDGGRLDRYSQTRLPHIWRHQEFSNLMLSLFNAGPDGGSGFSYGLRRARLGLVLSDPQFSRWFAHTYVGVDE